MYLNPASGKAERRLDAAQEAHEAAGRDLTADPAALAARLLDRAPWSLVLDLALVVDPDGEGEPTVPMLTEWLRAHVEHGQLVGVPPGVARAWTDWLDEVVERETGA